MLTALHITHMSQGFYAKTMHSDKKCMVIEVTHIASWMQFEWRGPGKKTEIKERGAEKAYKYKYISSIQSAEAGINQPLMPISYLKKKKTVIWFA